MGFLFATSSFYVPDLYMLVRYCVLRSLYFSGFVLFLHLFSIFLHIDRHDDRRVEVFSLDNDVYIYTI